MNKVGKVPPRGAYTLPHPVNALPLKSSCYLIKFRFLLFWGAIRDTWKFDSGIVASKKMSRFWRKKLDDTHMHTVVTLVLHSNSLFQLVLLNHCH